MGLALYEAATVGWPVPLLVAGSDGRLALAPARSFHLRCAMRFLVERSTCAT
jgi:hypothetical protein